MQKRLAWEAFAEFTYLSRRGRTLESIGKATLVPRLENIEEVASGLVPVLHGQDYLDKPPLMFWLVAGSQAALT